MYILIDHRPSVAASYRSGFQREGVASIDFVPADFIEWLQTATSAEFLAVDAFLLGECEGKAALPAQIRKYCQAPIIALRDLKSLNHTLQLFEAGVDDVVHVPVHIREVLVRSAAIRRRIGGAVPGQAASGSLRVFFDGRDPQIDGEPFVLPRRELRILEYMVTHQGRWITKTQIFNAIYGIFDAAFDESVIESHISKLRKKMRARLGYDPILSKRFVGYYLDGASRAFNGAEAADGADLPATRTDRMPQQFLTAAE